MSQSSSVGKEVLSYCSKCKLSLAHTIVAMKDHKNIAKVKCHTCQTIQKYKDPSTANSAKTRQKKTAQRPARTVSVAELWMDAISSTTKKSQPYSITDSYIAGDIIDHSKFGPGIIQKVIDDKIEVIFRHEIKLLIHNK